MTTPFPEPDDRAFWRLYAAAVPPRSTRLACPPLVDLAGYIDGRLDAPAVEHVETHLAECDDCRDAVVVSRATLAEYAGSADTPTPFAVIRRARGLTGRHVLRQLGRWGAAAAFATLAAIGGLEAGAATSGTDAIVESTLQDELSFGLLDVVDLDEDPLIVWSAELGGTP